ncbi:MAG: UPF0262 family protein, partial [Alphaproteobacteria bacterium]|nr:UPF0262 family protein [Alphaproteobacteria bacterium]
MSEAKFDETTDKIVAIDLDDKSVVRRSVEVEHERKVAMYDLLDMNRFRPVGDFKGPFKVRLGIEDGKRLVFKIDDEDDTNLTNVVMPLSPFRRIVRDYFQICESYYDAIKKLSPSQIETIDMARRGLHNEGSDVLRDRLESKMVMD